ncbi:MAG: rRNA pseudouridine synthase [Coprococcus sp.]|nr:rRNA pseudouridine synthase [Coprococcus sp.]
MMVRLDKYLADLGAGTRSEVKNGIRKGRAAVDGRIVKRPEEKIDADLCRVTYDGIPIAYRKWVYYMMNKPAGVVSAVKDHKERTVLDLLDGWKRKGLFPAGRLDKDTEGLLIITNDGDLAHRMLSPGKHVDKVYYAHILGNVSAEDAAAFAAGIDIGDDKPTLPAKLEILSADEVSEVMVTIHEGRYHQVKRMFLALGKQVIYLKRTAMGSLLLDQTLAPGEYRELTKEEIKQLC